MAIEKKDLPSLYVQLGDVMIDLLQQNTWATLEQDIEGLGLEWPERDGRGKDKFITALVKGWSNEELLAAGKAALPWYRIKGSRLLARLEDALEWVDVEGVQTISSVTRLKIGDALERYSPSGRLGMRSLLDVVDPHSGKGPSSLTNFESDGNQIYETSVFGGKRHPVAMQEFLTKLGVIHWPDRRFVMFLEAILRPERRDEGQQHEIADLLNTLLRFDGYHLVQTDELSGQPIFSVRRNVEGVTGRPKNLIFAANGPKPEIGFADAINNEIVVFKNEEYCLVFDEPMPREGLLWADLIVWWQRKTGLSDVSVARASLGRRLLDAIPAESPPERALFSEYFRRFHPILTDRLPALVPQVYLHYDPRTIEQLRRRPRLLRQRMDFLMLLPESTRVVLEVDGAQHYSENGKPSPSRYATMVKADRALRLQGYEVYRFGGYELQDAQFADTVEEFFNGLFSKHGVR